MASEIHKLSDEEIEKQLESNRSELRELRFTFAVARSLQDPARVRKLKRTVARLETVKNLRKLGKASVVAVEEKSRKKKK